MDFRSEQTQTIDQKDGLLEADQLNFEILNESDDPLLIDVENVCLMCGLNSRTIGK